jgi:hypothetical protein
MAAVPPAIDKKIGTEPPVFTDPIQWENWSRLLVTFINMNKSRFSSDAKMIQFATTLMTDGWPGTWAQRFVDEVLARAAAAHRPNTPDDADWGTWTNFYDSLKKSFEDPNRANVAAQTLDLLKQGKNTADQFFQRFDQLIKQANLNDDQTLINMLKRKLSPAVIDRIYASDSPIPITYDTFKEAAIKHDNRIREAIHIKAVNSGITTNIHYPGQTTHATASGDRRTGTGTVYGGQGQPMEIGRTKIDPAVTRSQGLCYTCGQKGHLSKNCHYKKTPTHILKRPDTNKKQAIRAMYDSLEQSERVQVLEDFLEDRRI